jgi:hypothetical protein
MSTTKVETKVIEYSNRNDMKKGILKMVKQGWELKTTTPVHHHPGCLLIGLCIITFGIFAFFLHGFDSYLCTFTRPVS